AGGSSGEGRRTGGTCDYRRHAEAGHREKGALKIKKSPFQCDAPSQLDRGYFYAKKKGSRRNPPYLYKIISFCLPPSYTLTDTPGRLFHPQVRFPISGRNGLCACMWLWL